MNDRAMRLIQTPSTWQNRWEGPNDSLQYLRAVVSKAKAMQQMINSIKDQDIFSQTINLSDLFRPDTFLNAFRQQTARVTKQPMDQLVLNSSWSGDVKHGKNISVKITGLQLEGCSFEGGRLIESAPDSPSVTSFPSCSIAWISQVNSVELKKGFSNSLLFSLLSRMSHNKRQKKRFHCQFISVHHETRSSHV